MMLLVALAIVVNSREIKTFGSDPGQMHGLQWPAQRSKLTFSKSRLLATFNYKIVGIKKFWSPKKKLIIAVISRGGHFVYVT